MRCLHLLKEKGRSLELALSRVLYPLAVFSFLQAVGAGDLMLFKGLDCVYPLRVVSRILKKCYKTLFIAFNSVILIHPKWHR